MIEMLTLETIGQVGFPIFVCLWFMLRTEKVINNNTKVMEQCLAELKNRKA